MKVVVVGLGSIAQKHISAIRELHPKSEIYALRSGVSASHTEGITDLYRVEQLREIHPDFIIVSNPTSKHYQTLLELAPLNIPLFIEKPLYENLYPVPQTGNYTYVACNLRFLDALQFVKKNIQNRRLNEVNVYCGSYLPGWRTNTDWRKAYSANKDLGGVVHLDLIHEIDYVFWLFGAPQQVHKVLRNQSSLAIDAFDYAHYCLEYPDFVASLVLNYYRRDYKRTLELVFDTETWEVDLSKNQVRNGDKIIFESEQTIAGTYREQMEFFIQSMRSGEQFNSIEEAYEVLKICLADEN